VRWLPFVKWFTPITGSFASGDRVVPFEMDWWGERPREPFGDTNAISIGGSPGVSPHQKVKTSTLICFEDVFPELARKYTQDDTDFLVNLTNDGWFGEGAAQWQQAAAAVFRAVENGVPLVRCCNNGLTCWADATGRLREIFRDKTGSVYGVGAMTIQIPVGVRGGATFYNRHGDWFGWLCVGFTGILFVVKISGQHRKRQL
jgi:apolipoprotein N-acyltransferase